MTFEETPYIWEERWYQTGYLPLRHAVLQHSCSCSPQPLFFLVQMEQAVPQRQPQQILNISSYKLFTANTNTAMYENAWSFKIHLILSPLLMYSIHSLLPHFPSVIWNLVHNLLQKKGTKGHSFTRYSRSIANT